MKRTIDAFKDETFDLLIVGGGITGAGVALDAALRGYRVALIDKGDFASGTSSVSSKLVHGGLRYLEQGAVRLVYEALHERRLLLHNAPHLVQPLRFVIPFYRGTRVRPWQWRTGLTVYDLLAGRSRIHRSNLISLSRLRREFPGLRTAGLEGGTTYFDAQMDDARLCLEVVRTAVAHGAQAANYLEAVAFETKAGPIIGVRALDRVGGNELLIRAKQVLNATGPWVDEVCRLAGDAGEPRLQPTKGVHLVAPDRGLASAFLLLHPTDGRVFFVIPWMGKTLIGTTDTAYHDRPDSIAVTDADLDYLLTGYNHYFQKPLQRSELLSQFAGVRPLVRSRAENPSSRSREFQFSWSPSGLLSVAGGKYTTYRAMAENIVDAVSARLQKRRACGTRQLRLAGAPEGDWEKFKRSSLDRLVCQHALNQGTAWHLIHRYGMAATEVAPYLARTEALKPVIAGEPDVVGEFAYQKEHEMALFPADHLLRRTRLGLFHPELLKILKL
jgi:glycerol-3-phosphate dehydrogenase